MRPYQLVISHNADFSSSISLFNRKNTFLKDTYISKCDSFSTFLYQTNAEGHHILSKLLQVNNISVYMSYSENNLALFSDCADQYN